MLENYTIGKSILLGSHWRVKFSTNNLTGEKVAIKIIKRDDMMRSIGMEEKCAYIHMHVESFVMVRE